MLKLKKLLVSLFIILNLIILPVFAVTDSEFETNFETWADGKSFSNALISAVSPTRKDDIENYVESNYSNYDYYMYYGSGYNSLFGYAYYTIIFSNNNAKLDHFVNTATYYRLYFDKDVNVVILQYTSRSSTFSDISSEYSSITGSRANMTMYVSGQNRPVQTLVSDGTVENTFYGYENFVESTVPIPPDPGPDPDPVIPDFTIALLLSSVSSGITDFSTFLNIIFADNFFVSIVLILISIFIILLAVRIIKKFMRRKDEKIF